MGRLRHCGGGALRYLEAMKTWTADERVILRRLYARTSDKVIAEHFGTSVEDVAQEAGRLALSKDKRVFKGQPMPRWTDEDESRLRELYETHSNREIARILGRSASSVKLKGARLGLFKSQLRRAIAGADNVRLRRANPPSSAKD